MTTIDALIAALTRSPNDPALRAALTDHLTEFPADIGRLVGWIGDGVQTAWERFSRATNVIPGGEFVVFRGHPNSPYYTAGTGSPWGPDILEWWVTPFFVRPETVSEVEPYTPDFEFPLRDVRPTTRSLSPPHPR